MFRTQIKAYSLDAESRADSKKASLTLYKNERFSRKIEFIRPISEKRQKPLHVLAFFGHFRLSDSKVLYMV